MILQGELQLDVDEGGRILTVRSKHRFRWFGALIAAFALTITAIITLVESASGPGFLVGLLVGLVLFGSGLFLMLPRSVSTVFDLSARRCQHQLRVGPWTRNRRYAFEDISGIGLKEFERDGGFTYMPMLFLADGADHALSTANGSALRYEDLLVNACRATGLARLDK